ncbi:MAG: hypothetical protein ACN0LA_09185 [Candidatus Longimicrobiales bacterium M2_2A_002]
MRFERWIKCGAALMVIVLSAAACDDSATDPVDQFDARDAEQAMESMISAVDTAELANAYGSLESASYLFSGAMATMLENPVQMDVRGLEPAAELAAEVIPSEYLGTTFVWDEGQLSYVAGDAPGAPADGVRVIYYAIDPITGQPASPLNPLGYVDLRDLSTAEANILALTVVRTSGEEDVTLADYTMELSFTWTQSSLEYDVASEGFLSNGTDQLNFDLSQSLSATETLVTIDQAYSLDLEGTGHAISFTATVTSDPSSQSEDPGTLEAVATITDGEQTVVLDVSYANNALDGSITHNGATVVLMGGDLDDPTFTDANGDPLSQEQLEALRQLWEHIGEMFEFVEKIFGFTAA